MAKKTSPESSAPAERTRLDAFTVREFESNGEKRSDWTRVGVAFPHSDGKGYNVVLHALPVDGKLTLRVYEPKEDGDAN